MKNFSLWNFIPDFIIDWSLPKIIDTFLPRLYDTWDIQQQYIEACGRLVYPELQGRRKRIFDLANEFNKKKYWFQQTLDPNPWTKIDEF